MDLFNLLRFRGIQDVQNGLIQDLFNLLRFRGIQDVQNGLIQVLIRFKLFKYGLFAHLSACADRGSGSPEKSRWYRCFLTFRGIQDVQIWTCSHIISTRRIQNVILLTFSSFISIRSIHDV